MNLLTRKEKYKECRKPTKYSDDRTYIIGKECKEETRKEQEERD